jgi:23S rRNA (adenine2503-C2)-methyltransferase
MTDSFKMNLYDLSFDDLKTIIDSWEEPEYRSQQIWQGLYNQYWSRFDQFSNLPLSLRNKLANHFRITSMEPIEKIQSVDGNTMKILFKLIDDQLIEAVLMRYKKRNTLCISTQAGCGMGCTFCATGKMGLKRNLSNGEIAEQVINFTRILSDKDQKVTNIVFMGMGEPFHNYDAMMQAVEKLNDPDGYNFGSRRMTISTVGIVPGIRRFTYEDSQVNLAISLHAADDELRSTMLPVNNKYPLNNLMNACLEYVQVTGRRITFEWALIKGINDTNEQAKKLAKLLMPFFIEGSPLCHVNLIPLNPIKGYIGLPAIPDQVETFRNILIDRAIPTTIRTKRGIEIQAGCGQLATSKIF